MANNCESGQILKCFSLNVRGLNDTNKRKKVFNWLVDQNSDIVFMQETFCTEKLLPYFNSNWKGEVFHSLTDSSHSRGTCILFKHNYKVNLLGKHCSSDGRILLIDIETNDMQMTLLSVYAPNTEKGRK